MRGFRLCRRTGLWPRDLVPQDALATAGSDDCTPDLHTKHDPAMSKTQDVSARGRCRQGIHTSTPCLRGGVRHAVLPSISKQSTSL